MANDPLNFVDPLGLCRAEDGTFTMSFEIDGEASPGCTGCTGSTDDKCADDSGDMTGTTDSVVVTAVFRVDGSWF